MIRKPAIWFAVAIAFLLSGSLSIAEESLKLKTTHPLPTFKIDGQPARIHSQGLYVTERYFYVTGRLESPTKRPLLVRFLRSDPAHVEHLELNVGDINADNKLRLDHPGGFDFDGEAFWIPVAASRPHTPTAIVRVTDNDAAPLADAKQQVAFRSDDHIGAIACDRERKQLYAANWDTETIYIFDLDGKVLETIARSKVVRDDPSWRLAVQDWKGLANGHVLLGAVDKSPQRSPSLSRSVVQLLSLDERNAEVTTRLDNATGTAGPMTREGLAIDDKHLYLLPDDLGNDAEIFQYELPASFVKQSAVDSPESRAVAFLSKEVPLWSRENKCYSCHNNGDAARALYLAKKLGFTLPESALADTTAWLVRPEGWDHNGGEGPFSDKPLARIQFVSALIAARDARLVDNDPAIRTAAEQIVKDQQADGSWNIEGDRIGSPATYGRVLATVTAHSFLIASDHRGFSEPVSKAENWLAAQRPQTVMDCAAILLAELPASDERTQQIQHCLERIHSGQHSSGGWGPYVASPPEPFDTALVLLALHGLPAHEDNAARIKAGRQFLIAEQQPDGSWLETTRPPGSESYAQRLSTAGWATLALLKTQQQ